MLTTTMDARDLARLDELNIAGLVSKPLTKEKITIMPAAALSAAAAGIIVKR